MKYTIFISIVEIIILLLLVKSIWGFALILSLSIIGPLISLVLYLHTAVKDVGIKLGGQKPIRVVAASIIVGLALIPVALYFSKGTLYGSMTAMAIGAVIIVVAYLPLLGILKGIERRDIDRIKRIGGGMPFAKHIFVILASYAEHFAKL